MFSPAARHVGFLLLNIEKSMAKAIFRVCCSFIQDFIWEKTFQVGKDEHGRLQQHGAMEERHARQRMQTSHSPLRQTTKKKTRCRKTDETNYREREKEKKKKSRWPKKKGMTCSRMFSSGTVEQRKNEISMQSGSGGSFFYSTLPVVRNIREKREKREKREREREKER